MRIYSFKFPKRFFGLLFITVFILFWAFLKTSNFSVQTISKINLIYEGSRNKNNGIYMQCSMG